jgi:hypothetical protein
VDARQVNFFQEIDGMAYDSPQFTTRREAFMGNTTAGATTEFCKFRHFQKMRLKQVHAAVVVAGTVTGHGYDVYHGTTSIGAITLSTNTAGSLANSAVLNEVCASMDQISVKSLADATGTAAIAYEFEVLPDAVIS